MPLIHRKPLFALLVALLATFLSTSLTFAQAGAWAIVSSPNQGTLGNHLYGVATVSANDIWAVGDYNDGPFKHYARTLAQHWNGNSWSIVPTPNPLTGTDDYDQLLAVAAVSTSNVWAVGYYGNDTGLNTETLIEHWNGSSWNVVASPNPTVSQYLYAVTVISANDIWAVGFYTDQQSQAGSGSLTVHWNGMTWSQVSNPGDTTLYGVTAVASNNVWAVGAFTNQQNLYGPLILHWNGTSWSIVGSPHAGTLAAVAAVSANDIWAVGYELYFYYYHTVIVHWNGKTWSQVSSPDPYEESNILYGVAVLSATSVWAVGLSGGQSLVARWNGTRWVRVPSPNRDTFDALQAAATAPATGDVWVVGEDLKIINNASYARTLIQQCRGC
jgi:hypothetical protein